MERPGTQRSNRGEVPCCLDLNPCETPPICRGRPATRRSAPRGSSRRWGRNTGTLGRHQRGGGGAAPLLEVAHKEEGKGEVAAAREGRWKCGGLGFWPSPPKAPLAGHIVGLGPTLPPSLGSKAAPLGPQSLLLGLLAKGSGPKPEEPTKRRKSEF